MWLASSSPLGQQLLLRLEARALVDRVVQLGIGVGHLPAVHEELEALHIVGVVGLFLGQRGNFDRVIHHERRLNQVLLDELLEEQVQDVALLVDGLELDMMRLRGLAALLRSVWISLKSTPEYFFTASTMVMRSKGLPRSISTPL